MSTTFSREDYTVAWICALPCELAAGISMLDEEHSRLSQHPTDDNNYIYGRIGPHNVVMTCLPAGGTGKASAAVAATHIIGSFRNLRFALMVGIGGGVPCGKDIRLGDVVVSHADLNVGGVIQFDFGKTIQEGRFMQTGVLNKPPRILRNAVSGLQAKYFNRPTLFSDHLLQMVTAAQYDHPGVQNDVLYESLYDHPLDNETCAGCDITKIVQRSQRTTSGPWIHLGRIASGDQVMRWGKKRDELWKEMKMDCFEMEAAGLMDEFPCLVVRGICDYADSHKNKDWQPYAAATAAAYTKELLMILPSIEPTGTNTTPEASKRTTVAPTITVPTNATSSKDTMPVNSQPGTNLAGAATDTKASQLHRAAVFNIEDTARRLLMEGVSANATCDGLTALHKAAEYGHVEIVVLLLQYNADLEIKDPNGWTALHWAAFYGRFAVAKKLLEHGANTDPVHGLGATPLYQAIIKEHIEIAEVLRSYGASITSGGADQWTPLHGAAFHGKLKSLNFLLEHKVEVDAKNIRNETPLWMAAGKGNVEVMKVLIAHGADINSPARSGSSPLHIAGREGRMAAIQLLIDSGCKLEARDEVGATPLYRAAERGNDMLVQLLLDRGASVNCRNPNEWAPLHIASSNGHESVIKVLLSNGAMIDAGNSHGCTPLYLAAFHNREAAVTILLEHGANTHARQVSGWQALHAAVLHDSKAIVQKLLTYGAPIEDAVDNGQRPLYIASSKGHTEIVKCLLSKGANVEGYSADSWLPLHIAAKEGHVETVRVLLNNGAPKLSQTSKGQTARDLAVEHGHNAIVELLDK